MNEIPATPESPEPQEPPEPTESQLMMQLLGGFQISQALYVVAKLDIAARLDDGPLSVDDLAAHCGVRSEPLRRLVRTLTALGVFRQPRQHREDRQNREDREDREDREGGEVGREHRADQVDPVDQADLVETTSLGATLSSRRPDSVRDLALYWMETHYLPFSDLLHTVRTGEPATHHYLGQPFFDWVVADPDIAALQSRAMASFAGGVRARMFHDYRLPEGAVVADIGGADGTILARLLRSDPTRRGILFDLPAIVPTAQKKLAELGMTERVDVVAGDFFESVPSADVYVLASILHDWDDASCVRILQSIREAANPGARLVVIEGVVPPGDALHVTKFTDLTMLGIVTGKERDASEFRELLDSAGFTLERIVPTPEPYSFVEARLS